MFDFGENWSDNTTFGPVRMSFNSMMSDKLLINSRIGLSVYNNKRSVYGYAHFRYNDYFHGYLYPRIVSDPKLFRGYSGVVMERKRAGFSSGETDLSGICFQNRWMIIQFGRGRQSWGAGNDIQLALSESSNSYDYGMMDLDFGRLKVRYFHGFLESDSISTNRYISGRGIEWNNNKNIILGLSEIVIYSGINRSLDIAYLNPISTHLEVELNKRQNEPKNDSGNGVWQFSLDFKPANRIRLSFNYLIDEFVLDRSQSQNDKDSGKALSIRTVYKSNINDQHLISYYFSFIHVGTNTFRHEDGKNNFVQRERPLGWEFGSDARDYNLGLQLYSWGKIIVLSKIGRREVGENNLTYNLYAPYQNYQKTSFPSGNVNEIDYVTSQLQFQIQENIILESKLDYSISNLSGKNLEASIGVNYFFYIKDQP